MGVFCMGRSIRPPSQSMVLQTPQEKLGNLEYEEEAISDNQTFQV